MLPPNPAKPVLPLAFVAVEGVAAPGEPHASTISADGDAPADAFAARQDDPDGVPPPPVPFASLAEKSSEALVGVPPHAVPRLTSVGVPGVASAVLQVEALVGSCAEPTLARDPPKAFVAVEWIVARTPPDSVVETVVRLASASADGPLVVGAGALPSGGVGSGSSAVALSGAFALVPGPDALVDPCESPAPGAGAVVLDAVTGSLDETAAGPALPPLAVAVPPAAGDC